jgi:integrase
VYDLRHRFASAVLNRWIDEKRDLYAMLPYLRAYMGHSDLSATEYYVHLLPENLVKSDGINWAALESVIPEVGV